MRSICSENGYLKEKEGRKGRGVGVGEEMEEKEMIFYGVPNHERQNLKYFPKKPVAKC